MDWSKEEVDLIVKNYFKMFDLELRHKSYNKAEFRRQLTTLIPDRKNAIEFKHRNISGVLAKMGYPYIKGYKPLFNFQQLLADETALFVDKHKTFFEKEFMRFSEEKIDIKPKKIDFEKIIDKAPVESNYKEREPRFLPFKTNYLEKEQNNRNNGEAGEKLVIEYEKWRLFKAKRESLINKIKWVSKERGDGLGFDILSKNEDGSDRFIEVKTTKLSKETPIFLSKNEMAFANMKGDKFYLYRVFNIVEEPQIFIKQGVYENYCKMIAQTYKGYFY